MPVSHGVRDSPCRKTQMAINCSVSGGYLIVTAIVSSMFRTYCRCSQVVKDLTLRDFVRLVRRIVHEQINYRTRTISRVRPKVLLASTIFLHSRISVQTVLLSRTVLSAVRRKNSEEKAMVRRRDVVLTQIWFFPHISIYSTVYELTTTPRFNFRATHIIFRFAETTVLINMFRMSARWFFYRVTD